jgi:hypothetical protein
MGLQSGFACNPKYSTGFNTWRAVTLRLQTKINFFGLKPDRVVWKWVKVCITDQRKLNWPIFIHIQKNFFLTQAQLDDREEYFLWILKISSLDYIRSYIMEIKMFFGWFKKINF